MGGISGSPRSRGEMSKYPIPIDPFAKPDRVEHDYYEEDDD
jgi:hypothetical protein